MAREPQTALRPRPARARWFVIVVLIVVLILGPRTVRVTSGQVIEDNDALHAVMVSTIIAHDLAIPFGFVPEPTTKTIANTTQLELELFLKGLRPILEPPPDIPPLMPNTPDRCSFKFVLPQAETAFDNKLGIINIRKPLGKWKKRQDPADVDLHEIDRIAACLASHPSAGPLILRWLCDLPDNNWGILGPPGRLWHANTEVLVGVSSGTAGINAQERPQVVTMPAGYHTLDWYAATQMSFLYDYIVPVGFIALQVATEFRTGPYADEAVKAAKSGDIGDEAAEDVAKASKAVQFKAWLLKKMKEKATDPKFLAKIGFKVTGALGVLERNFTTNASFASQQVAVFDVFPPTISTSTSTFQIEATDFGGTRTGRTLAQFRQAITASDACGRDVILRTDAPPFLPLGSTTVTWTATDLGPNPSDGKNYSPSVQQTIRVVDTQPPLLLAPPSRVVETTSAQIDGAELPIGSAVAVDLADPEPVLSNDAPDVFLTNSRTEVTWAATDASGNMSSGSQWITVKATGTNTPPSADDRSAATLTAEPVDIVLTAHDDDVLDGMSDPVWFSIAERPAHGEFVAPLLPFFIDDYRTNPGDLLGPAFAQAVLLGNAHGWLSTNVCKAGLQPPVGFVFGPLFVHVMDDGTRYVLDSYFTCDLEKKAVDHPRISKWDRDGAYLGQKSFSPDTQPSNDAFVFDRDGFMYYSTITQDGSSSEMFLYRCSADFERNGGTCFKSWKFRRNMSPAFPIEVADLSYARIDSGDGIIFVTDRYRIYAVDEAGNLLGVLSSPDHPDKVFLGRRCAISSVGSNVGFGMEVDSAGSLYVADSCAHRVHKFTRSYIGNDGAFVPGDYVGWMGKCTRSSNNACDVDRQMSKGYSCTDSTCAIDASDVSFGTRPGQFHTPLFLAIDPNDILYVADYDNFRVQRFAPDGSFAGEAASTGTGINKGTKPSFILGNMDRPRALSVNSTQFFVVDRDEQFVHIFGTLPFKDITDHSATVTYVSRHDFHSAADTFTYTVSDGLAVSAPAVVTVDVARNFRPPTALAADLHTDEDTPLEITLGAEDPDGIAGVDFNGLDTLTFAVATGPRHGELVGSGAGRTYTPAKGYYGPDEFTFVVDDGMFTSDAATVTIDVLPANDPPEVALVALPRVGRGFATAIRTTFTDDPSGPYSARVEWGDGGIDVTGGLVHNGDTGQPELHGVAVTGPAMDRPGSAVAQHTYSATGTRQLRFCVTDSDGAAGCATGEVTVEELVSLGLGGAVSDPVVDHGASFTYRLDLSNAEPTVGAGRAAAGVVLEGSVPGEVVVEHVTSTSGACAVADGRLHCTFALLLPGTTETVTVTVRARDDLIYDVDPRFSVEARTDTPAVSETVETLLSNEIVTDATDTDGDGMSDVFESVYGLNPMLDDAGGDLDHDGLTNLREYQERTSPVRADTDDDGLDDLAEVDEYSTDPLNADTDGDRMPDGWEVRFGLNPLVDDADEDADGDGVSNYKEYLAGTNPSPTTTTTTPSPSTTTTTVAACFVDRDCEDGNPCTDDACAGGRCRHEDNLAACDDGDACTSGDGCSNGTCVAGAPVDALTVAGLVSGGAGRPALCLQKKDTRRVRAITSQMKRARKWLLRVATAKTDTIRQKQIGKAEMTLQRARTLTDRLARKLTPACHAAMLQRVIDAQARAACL